MSEIKFDSIKEKIKSYVRGSLRNHPEQLLLCNVQLMKEGITPVNGWVSNKTSDELVSQIISVINWWDIRCYDKLLKAFPDVVFPKWVATAKIGYNENCEWVLYN